MVHPFINLLHLLVYSICWHGHPLYTPFLVLSVGLVHLYLICLFILCDTWYFCLIDSVSLFHLFLCWLDKVHLFVTFACLIHLFTSSACLFSLLVWYIFYSVYLSVPSVERSICLFQLLFPSVDTGFLFIPSVCLLQLYGSSVPLLLWYICLLQLYGSSVPLLLWYICLSVAAVWFKCPITAVIRLLQLYGSSVPLLLWYICLSVAAVWFKCSITAVIHLFVCSSCMVQVFHYCCDTSVCL